jgi:hypothetical protein
VLLAPPLAAPPLVVAAVVVLLAAFDVVAALLLAAAALDVLLELLAAVVAVGLLLPHAIRNAAMADPEKPSSAARRTNWRRDRRPRRMSSIKSRAVSLAMALYPPLANQSYRGGGVSVPSRRLPGLRTPRRADWFPQR